MNKLVSDYLLYLGFNPIRSGYKYLRDLIIMQLTGINIMPLKVCGYSMIARLYDKSADVIDKNIQNSIAHVWLKGDLRRLEKEFGATIDPMKGKPTNKQFIATLVDKISLIIKPIDQS